MHEGANVHFLLKLFHKTVDSTVWSFWRFVLNCIVFYWQVFLLLNLHSLTEMGWNTSQYKQTIAYTGIYYRVVWVECFSSSEVDLMSICCNTCLVYCRIRYMRVMAVPTAQTVFMTHLWCCHNTNFILALFEYTLCCRHTHCIHSVSCNIGVNTERQKSISDVNILDSMLIFFYLVF